MNTALPWYLPENVISDTEQGALAGEWNKRPVDPLPADPLPVHLASAMLDVDLKFSTTFPSDTPADYRVDDK